MLKILKYRNTLISLGIILLISVILAGGWTFIKRHNNRELIPPDPIVTKIKPIDTTAAPRQAEQTPVPTRPAVPPTFDKTSFSIDNPASIWVVVNKQRPLSPIDYAPQDLVTVSGYQKLRYEAAAALGKLIAAAKVDGLTISGLSGYRSYSTQVTVYGNEVKNNGQAVADTQSAKPGYSEHQTGWSIDVGGGGCGIEDCFGETAEGKWLALHAYEYGFIVRYTEVKQSITGYRAEPWHIRYIGMELSAEMHKQNITTLEEFFGL